jgi:lysophospholipase L1-like esterase
MLASTRGDREVIQVTGASAIGTTAVERSSARLARLLAALTFVAVAATSCSASPGSSTVASPSGESSATQSSSTSAAPLSSKYPNSIVVLGHSGTTGYNSDPDAPGTNALSNSWATGDNPAVNSIYTRLLALNPAVAGHGINVGVNGSAVADLDSQIGRALAVEPSPDLVMVQLVDKDLQCDGTDKDNYARFAETLTTQLTRITTASAKARILLVSSPPGTVQNYGEVVAALPVAKAKNTGTGPCDMFSPSGEAVPANWTYQDTVIKGYQAKLAEVCKQFPTCVYDGGALYRMPITAEDLASDGEHLSVAGHKKQAALEWKILGFDS